MNFLLLDMFNSGKKKLSASGMHIPDTLYDIEVVWHFYGQDCKGMVLVVIVAYVVKPFLSLQQRKNVTKVG